MAHKIQSSDRHRGALPEIRCNEGQITYILRSPKDAAAVIIRCDPDGELWVSLGADATADPED
jgi:hypothetical protein